jgi:zinc transport system substrate-binding protein
LNGADYAGWTELVTLPESALVNAAANIQDRFIEEEELIHHSHGPHGEHTHGGTAFTLWLDPNLAIEQARSIQLALASALPQYAELFEQRFTQLMEDLLALDSSLKAAIGDNAARPVFVSHPVYQYLEARYALNAVSFHWEPDEMPTEAEWRELAHILENHPARWMIWEDEPLPEIAARLQAAGVASVVFNPTSQPPEAGDFLSAMQANAEALRIVYAD